VLASKRTPKGRFGSTQRPCPFVRIRPAAHINLGNVLRWQNRLAEAEAPLRRAIELDPDDPDAHVNLGALLNKQGRFAEAEVPLRRAIELDPDDLDAHRNLGLALLKQERFAEAEKHHRRAIELDPDITETHYNLGLVLRQQERFAEAEKHYRRAIELDPKFASAHNNLGNVLRAQGKLDEAIACFRKAIEVDPKFTFAHFNLGEALREQGKLEEAIACYRKASELQPNSARFLNNLAWRLATVADVQLRNPKEAMELAQQAVRLDPKPWVHWNTLSVACSRAGEWQEALRAREEAIRRDDKGSRMCWNGLGMTVIRWQLGQKEEARQAYDRVAEESRKYPGLQEFRQEAAELLGIEPTKSKED
jgi:tetratricopeptide (TPR) repeat protein